MTTSESTTARTPVTRKQRKAVIAGAVGTLMEYYDYYLYGLAAAAVFPAVFFSSQDPVVAQLSSFATFAVGFFLRPLGGIVFGHIGDRFGRRPALLITVIGMGAATVGIGLIPPTAAIGLLAPILLIICRMLQGLFVGGEMGGATTLVVEHAPPGRRGLFGALLISGAGIANVASAGSMAALGLGSDSFFIEWGWRIPFLFAAVLTIVAIALRASLDESDEFKAHTATIRTDGAKPRLPLWSVLRRPKNLILGILIGLPQSIAGYIILTFGFAQMVASGVDPQVGFIGTMIVGALQIFVAPLWGAASDRLGRRNVYVAGCIGFALLIYPAFQLYATGEPLLIWCGMVLGFIIPGVAMQATLHTMLSEMFDVEARTTGVNMGYQLSNTLGGGLAPLIATSLVAAFGGIWAVVVYAAVICIVGVIATAYASLRTDAPATDTVSAQPHPQSESV